MQFKTFLLSLATVALLAGCSDATAGRTVGGAAAGAVIAGATNSNVATGAVIGGLAGAASCTLPGQNC